MIEYIILDQLQSKVTREKDRSVVDDKLWEDLLRLACLSRARVYLEENLYDKDILTEDGQFRESCDEYSTHILALDNGKVVGSVRITPLKEGEVIKHTEINYFFEKFKLPRHARTFYHLLQESFRNNHIVTEVARLAVEEEYRRFKNVHSQVGITLITMCYSWGIDNDVYDCFIVQGNKYRTSDIYERLGFRIVRDIDTHLPLEPFFDGGDICQLMYLDVKNPTQLFIKFVNRFKHFYDNAKVVKREK